MRTNHWLRCLGLLVAFSPSVVGAAGTADDRDPAWARAHRHKPMTAPETRAWIKRLVRFVHDNHLKTDPRSAQRGLVYEYFDVARKGRLDQFVQGEALDTMHDGAWLAAALATAFRATGDDFCKTFLTRWQLPFYCKMLNHSDTLFSPKRQDARANAHRFNREHALQPGEKGFVPYWWDDGGSVSLERRRDRNPLGPFPCTDFLAGKPNPRFQLNGYSHGSSNHLAQDLGVMVQLAWLLLRDSHDAADRQLAAEVAAAARHLQECRMRHHGHIPMCDAPAALATGDAALMKFVPDQSTPAGWQPGNHYTRALYDFKPGQAAPFPGFADDQHYRYYFGIARHAGRLPRPLAFKTIYDAYTEPLLYRCYSDDAEVPAGINRFDLHPYSARDGKPTDYRSDRKGPGGRPRPIGSRMGPQNMVCCGWGLQMLRAYPGIWEERYRRNFARDGRVFIVDPPPGQQAGKTVRSALSLGDVTLSLVSSRSALRLQGTCKTGPAVIKVFSRPGGQGAHAVLTLSRDRAVRAVNDKGEMLVVKGECKATTAGLRFDLELPYTMVKGQKAWANGVEHGRYSIQAGGVSRDLYLASTEAQVRAWLEHELAGGLRTWEAIFRVKGYIPTGIGAGADWDRFSDSGGYAHLISAASQWLLYLDGKKDWEVQRIPELSRSK